MVKKAIIVAHIKETNLGTRRKINPAILEKAMQCKIPNLTIWCGNIYQVTSEIAAAQSVIMRNLLMNG